jgi:hypothetical protein
MGDSFPGIAKFQELRNELLAKSSQLHGLLFRRFFPISAIAESRWRIARNVGVWRPDTPTRGGPSSTGQPAALSRLEPRGFCVCRIVVSLDHEAIRLNHIMIASFV